MEIEGTDARFLERVAEQSFIQRVYQWMSLGLAASGAVALWAAANVGVLRTVLGGGFWLLVLAELGLVWWLSASISKISARAAIIGFLAYAVLNGLTLSVVFLVYTRASIASTFFITAGTFGAVSVYGWGTRRDLTSLGGFLFMALVGVVIASLVNVFLHSAALEWVLTYVGLAVFIGLTAYDTQRLKAIHKGGGAATEQLAILGALALYLDFINMFLFMLRLFGRRRN